MVGGDDPSFGDLAKLGRVRHVDHSNPPGVFATSNLTSWSGHGHAVLSSERPTIHTWQRMPSPRDVSARASRRQAPVSEDSRAKARVGREVRAPYDGLTPACVADTMP
jgi:hypothetical protein